MTDYLEHLGNRLPFVSAANNTTHLHQIRPARIPSAWAASACNDTCHVGLGVHFGSILREVVPHTTRKSLHGKIRIVHQHPHAKMLRPKVEPDDGRYPRVQVTIQLPVVFGFDQALELKRVRSLWRNCFPRVKDGIATLRRRTIPGSSKFNPTIQRSHCDIQFLQFRDHQHTWHMSKVCLGGSSVAYPAIYRPYLCNALRGSKSATQRSLIYGMGLVQREPRAAGWFQIGVPDRCNASIQHAPRKCRHLSRKLFPGGSARRGPTDARSPYRGCTPEVPRGRTGSLGGSLHPDFPRLGLQKAM